MEYDCAPFHSLQMQYRHQKTTDSSENTLDIPEHRMPSYKIWNREFEQITCNYIIA